MRTLKEINKGCKNCTMPEIHLCNNCFKEWRKTFKAIMKNDPEEIFFRGHGVKRI